MEHNLSVARKKKKLKRNFNSSKLYIIVYGIQCVFYYRIQRVSSTQITLLLINVVIL